MKKVRRSQDQDREIEGDMGLIIRVKQASRCIFALSLDEWELL
jgi:hypothetical protein